MRFAREIEAGQVYVNGYHGAGDTVPFGGMKQSGIGRDGGDYSFDFYMETKNVSMATGQHRIPRLGAG
jgi:5-carboxymethyl-2-hydroxymuconic-semialdehyde dehydrogenase